MMKTLDRQLKPGSRLARVLVIGGVLMAAGSAMAATEGAHNVAKTPDAQQVSLVVGKSTVVDMPVAIKRASLADPQIADAIVLDTFAVIHPDDMPRVARRLAKMIQNPDDTGSHTQCRVRHKDGTWRVVDAFANNLLLDAAVKGIVVVIHKIGRRHQGERALAEEAASLASATKYRLTGSEYRVLTLITEGKSNPQIAEELVVSSSTVRFHVTSILRKLGVTSRTQPAAIALRRHLVE